MAKRKTKKKCNNLRVKIRTRVEYDETYKRLSKEVFGLFMNKISKETNQQFSKDIIYHILTDDITVKFLYLNEDTECYVDSDTYNYLENMFS